MSKPRKMLSDINAPYLQSLMRTIETQSRQTISKWCLDYAEAHLLPLWKQAFPNDLRPENAMNAARSYLTGDLKLPQAKSQIMECRKAAREAEGHPIAQAAARTIDSAASAIHNSAGSLGLALYGSVAVAYDQAGIDAPWETVEALAEKECLKMEAALKAVSVENEPNPAKITWNC